MGQPGRRPAALAGVAACALAIGVAELVAVATGPRSAPLVAVAGVVADTVPEPVKQFAIDLFGVHDKTALLVGIGVLLGAAAGLVGVLAARRMLAGWVGIGLFGLIGVAAAVTRPGAGPATALPTVLGVGAAGFFLWAAVAGPLRIPPGRAPTAPDRATTPVDEAARAVGLADGRRRFLRGVVAAAGGAALAGLGGRWLATRRGVTDARAAVVLPEAVGPAQVVPAEAHLPIPGLSPYVTPNRSFYRIDTAFVVPQIDPEDWRLRIHGRVRNPFTISYAELLALPMVARYITLACVSNEVGGDLIGNARWLGVPVRDLLDRAEPLAGADQVVGRAVDGWTCGTPTAVLRDGRDALLAVGMNGEPLPVEHGFPVRMVVPGLYGYVSACKWLAELELTSFADFDAYWIPRGWAAEAPIKTQSRIDTPRPGASLTAGPVMVAGVAWAQHQGVRGVQVRVDGGRWQPAALAATVSIDTWVQWSWRWDATPGSHTFEVRATDSTGLTQPEERRRVLPDGATGWHSVRVAVA